MKKTLLFLTGLAALNSTAQLSTTQANALIRKTSLFVTAHSRQNKQASIISLRDSTHYSNWNTTTLEWNQNNKAIYQYNVANKESAYLYAAQVSGVWQDNNQRLNYSYDVNNNLLGYETQFWNFPGWKNNGKNVYTYDNAGNCLTELYQNWDAVASSWLNNGYTINTYDANHNVLTILTKNWNVATSSWDNHSRVTMTYNTSNEYSSYVTEVWNSSTLAWENSDRYINIVYANGNMMSLEAQYYDANISAYVTSSRITNTYDGNHHVLSSVTEQFDINTTAWINSDKVNYTYDANGNEGTRITQTWDSNSNSWKNSLREQHYYTITVGLNNASQQEETIELYPSPANEFIAISTKGTATFAELNIVDVTGQTVLTEKTKGVNAINVNISALPSGIYFAELKDDAFKIYRKFIKN